MTEHGHDPDVDQFLREQIDTVPHLEALLLLWNSRPRIWSAEHMAKGLFLASDAAGEIMEDLARRHLILAVPGTAGTYRYVSEADRDHLVGAVDSTYRRELIRVSRLIHSKPPAAVREFARAFRIKKDRD